MHSGHESGGRRHSRGGGPGADSVDVFHHTPRHPATPCARLITDHLHLQTPSAILPLNSHAAPHTFPSPPPAAVDWWSLGILIYELVYGTTPFRGARRDETFENIIKAPLRFPTKPTVSAECQVGRGARDCDCRGRVKLGAAD